jgi:hypothetical protein
MEAYVIRVSGFYGCIDADVPLRLFWWLFDEMNTLGIWDGM